MLFFTFAERMKRRIIRPFQSVKIGLISYYYRDSDYNYNYFVDVSYKMFTDSDLEAELSAKQAENDAVDNDL